MHRILLTRTMSFMRGYLTRRPREKVIAENEVLRIKIDSLKESLNQLKIQRDDYRAAMTVASANNAFTRADLTSNNCEHMIEHGAFVGPNESIDKVDDDVDVYAQNEALTQRVDELRHEVTRMENTVANILRMKGLLREEGKRLTASLDHCIANKKRSVADLARSINVADAESATRPQIPMPRQSLYSQAYQTSSKPAGPPRSTMHSTF